MLLLCIVLLIVRLLFLRHQDILQYQALLFCHCIRYE